MPSLAKAAGTSQPLSQPLSRIHHRAARRARRARRRSMEWRWKIARRRLESLATARLTSLHLSPRAIRCPSMQARDRQKRRRREWRRLPKSIPMETLTRRRRRSLSSSRVARRSSPQKSQSLLRRHLMRRHLMRRHLMRRHLMRRHLMRRHPLLRVHRSMSLQRKVHPACRRRSLRSHSLRKRLCCLEHRRFPTRRRRRIPRQAA